MTPAQLEQVREALRLIVPADLDNWADIGGCFVDDGAAECTCDEEARRIVLRDAIREALAILDAPEPAPSLEDWARILFSHSELIAFGAKVRTACIVATRGAFVDGPRGTIEGQIREAIRAIDMTALLDLPKESE